MLTYEKANAKRKEFLEQKTSKYVIPALEGPTAWIWEASTTPGEAEQMGEREQGRRKLRLGNHLTPSGRAE